MLRKIYDFEFLNQWPYEKDVAVRVAAEDEPIVLRTDGQNARMHRTYLRFPDRHVSWALVEGADPYDHSLASFAARVGEIWVQIEYAVFTSRKRSDDTRLDGLRRTLQAEGLDAIPFPPDLRPAAYHIGTYDDAFHTFRHEGEVRRQPFHVLYVSELGDLPIINYHTIPEDEDFTWVDAQVVTYGRYDALPTYAELLDRLARYCACFDGSIAAASVPAAKRPRATDTERKAPKRKPRSRRSDA
jgi:hypothetical protein